MEQQQMYRQGDEIELIDLIRVLIRRKMMIVLTTVLITIAAVVVCFLLPQKYSVSFLLELGQDEDGKAIVSPQSVKVAIENDAYSDAIRNKLSLDEQTGLKFKIQTPKNTDLLYVNYQTAQPELGLTVLQQLQQLIDVDVNKKLEQKKERIKNEISLAVIEKNAWEPKIKLLYSQIEQQQHSVAELKQARKMALEQPARDVIALLLYSNEIKSGLEYLNQKNEKLKDYETGALTADVKLQMLNKIFDQLQGVYVYKKPTISEKPVSPKKPLIVALAFMLGLMGSVMLAFLLEYLHQHKLTLL